MALKYHGEGDMGSSSTFSPKSVNLKYRGMYKDGDRGQNSWASPCTSWELTDPAQIQHAAQRVGTRSGDRRASSCPPAFLL